MFTMVMSFSIVFIALNSIAEDFGESLRAVSWVIVAQSLTISAVMLPLGRLADIIGRKKVHLIGQALFIAGAIFAAFSPTLGILIFARVIMSVGSAMGQAVGTAIILSVFPSSERGKAIGSQTTAVAIGGAAGPIIGGVLLQWWSWQSLFIVMAIPMAIAFVWSYIVLDESRISQSIQGKRPPYDWIGAGLSASAVTVLVVTINNPFAVSWISPLIVGGSALTAALLAAFVYWELRNPAPMLDLRMFKNIVFALAIATRWLGFMGTTATRFLMPIFLISFRGMSEGSAAGVLFVSAVGMAIAAQTSGRLSDRFGARWFAVMGFGVIVATSLGFAFITGETALWWVMVVTFANGLGMGLWSVPNNTTILGAISRSRYGVVSALTNLTRNVGNVTGQAVASAIVVGIMAADGFDIPLNEINVTPGAGDSFLSGWKIAYFGVVGFALAGGGLAFFTREPRAAPEDRESAGKQ